MSDPTVSATRSNGAALAALAGAVEALAERPTWPLAADLGVADLSFQIRSDRPRDFLDVLEFAAPHMAPDPACSAPDVAGPARHGRALRPEAGTRAAPDRWSVVVTHAPHLPASAVPAGGRARLLAHSSGNQPRTGHIASAGGWRFVWSDRTANLIAVHPAARSAVVASVAPGPLVPARASDLSVDAHATLRLLTRWHLRRSGLLVVHAAAVEWSGMGLLLAGGKGSGKTTAQLALLVRYGAAYVAGDRAFVHAGEGRGLRMSGWPSTFRPAAASIALFPELDGHQWSAVARAYSGAGPGGGELKLDWSPAAVGFYLGCATLPACRLDAIVLPRHRPGSSGYRLGPVSDEELAEHVLPASDPAYPDWLELEGDEPEADARAAAIRARLAQLPRIAVEGGGHPAGLCEAIDGWLERGPARARTAEATA